MRSSAKDLSWVFFLVLFACSRDSYVKQNDFGEKAKEENSNTKSRGAKGGVSSVKIANFTYVFGSDPASGAQSDKKFVNAFIKHLNNMFDPEDGSLMIPECLGNIDTITNRVNFESTSSNVGRSLKLMRQDVRIS